ncbi:MAG TPA: hypothetical protein VH912_30110 [Streptosporangiaceae bacterium]|jgi:hypothetical protein
MSVDAPPGRSNLGETIVKVKDSGAFRVQSVLYAVCASIALTLITESMGKNPRASVTAAAIGPVVTMIFSTRGPRTARTIGIVLVTALAALVAVTGVSTSELLRGGKSLFGNRPGTFVQSGTDTSGTGSVGGTGPEITQPSGGGGSPGPGIEVERTPSCPQTPIDQSAGCDPIVVRSAGEAALLITGVEVTGSAAGDFTATPECTADSALADGDSCTIQVTFHPTGSDAGADRHAVVVVHQNLPGAPTTVEVTGVAAGSTEPPPVDTLSPEPQPSQPL